MGLSATILACLGPLLAGLAAPEGGDDRVLLKDGRALAGRVVFQDGSKLVLRRNTRDTTLKMEEVERVDSRLRDLYALLDNLEDADREDPEDLELLVSQAEECGLTGEADLLRWRRLLALRALGKDDEATHLALGHEKHGQTWLVSVGTRRVDWDTRIEMARDWGGAWEFSSLHYRLRSNLSLEATLDLLPDIERVYRAYFDLLGSELELYEVCRPMRVNVHADAASYPEVGLESGIYVTVDDQVHLDASNGFYMETLAHELTHQLLYDTLFRERNRDGEVPPWLNEGLAEYLAAGVEDAPGIRFDPGRPVQRHFEAHARAKDPIDLKRILSLSTDDFLASSDRDLKYAQSYTLVHFLLHGDGGRYRDGLFEFLRAVARGKGSSTDLKRALGAGWHELGKAWEAHVRGTSF